MHWLYVNIDHNNKHVYISAKEEENTMFGSSYNQSTYNKIKKHCEDYAKNLALQWSYLFLG